MPTGHEKTAIPSGTVSVTAMVPLNWIPAPSSGPYRDKLQTACRLPWFPPTPRFGRRSVYTLTQSIVTTDSQTIAAKLNGEYIRAKNNNQRLSILGSRSAYHGTKLHYQNQKNTGTAHFLLPRYSFMHCHHRIALHQTGWAGNLSCHWHLYFSHGFPVPFPHPPQRSTPAPPGAATLFQLCHQLLHRHQLFILAVFLHIQNRIAVVTIFE